ncbi:unnamed protein product, partial [Nesidiocoris tenuis]
IYGRLRPRGSTPRSHRGKSIRIIPTLLLAIVIEACVVVVPGSRSFLLAWYSGTSTSSVLKKLHQWRKTGTDRSGS